ncbi:MAG: inositol monophosphatase family protein [Actinomycetota bacterium]|nr:inositol monophosphatase family protein [Actinomycetota bacterium]
METDLQLAQRAAMTGAAVALPHFEALAELSREVKADGSVVTAADRAVESAIRDVLTAARPSDAILGEEEGQTGSAGRRWIIDPIDGTALFVAGDNRWLILIALEVDGEVTTAVAAHPAQGSVWWATRGGGAFEGRFVGGRVVAETPVHVTTNGAAGDPPYNGTATPTPTATGTTTGTGTVTGPAPLTTPVPPTARVPSTAPAPQLAAPKPIREPGIIPTESPLTHIPEMSEVVAGSRLGVVPEEWNRDLVAPLKRLTPALPWPIHPALMVARGDLDLAVQTGGQIWDFAATSLIVREAGGSYSGINGRPEPGPGASVYARSDALRLAALDVVSGSLLSP